ncbi:lipopolysaccharide biosynthesis protein [Caballeronia sp. LZ035]|uniref:lipopolysaccharide biosynthesis protein n=1 Tax=Caballeronia sp. LZ035 TaxID=3038568 RepID=UPI0028615750|nr:lipopolysaccharide biosynthesis protein [Caballeronia sp. LZ035]MDR5760070.1 lipopolysaccharide biosynthesis protein [Caballeronia sp. LZ035]
MTNRNQTSVRRFTAFSARKITAVATAVLTSVLLAACGGGGDSALDAAATAKASDLPDSTAKAATSTSIFYGVNGRNTNGGAYDGTPVATQLAQLKDLGAKIYRNDVYNVASAAVVAKMTQTMAAGGVTVYPVLMLGANYNNEQDAYNAGYTLGRQVAQTYNWQYYEVANELEAQALNGNVDGTNWKHYNNQPFVVARGVYRGLIAGVKSVNSSAKIIINGTWLHYSFFQMLLDGSQPDGTHGHPTVSWDITAWHWYSDQGDMTHACGGSGCYDMLAVLKSLGRPIWINEFGVRPNYGSDQQIANYMAGNTMMAQFQSVASKYNIQSIQQFELYDDSEGNFGLLRGDGKTQKPAYTAYKNFVASHPM